MPYKDPKKKAEWAKRKFAEKRAEEFAKDPIAAAKKREGRAPGGTMLPVVEAKPDEVAEVVAIAANPLIDNFSRAVRETGISPTLAKKIKGKLDRELLPVKLAVEEVMRRVADWCPLPDGRCPSSTQASLMRLEPCGRPLVFLTCRIWDASRFRGPAPGPFSIGS